MKVSQKESAPFIFTDYSLFALSFSSLRTKQSIQMCIESSKRMGLLHLRQQFIVLRFLDRWQTNIFVWNLHDDVLLMLRDFEYFFPSLSSNLSLSCDYGYGTPPAWVQMFLETSAPDSSLIVCHEYIVCIYSCNVEYGVENCSWATSRISGNIVGGIQLIHDVYPSFSTVIEGNNLQFSFFFCTFINYSIMVHCTWDIFTFLGNMKSV